MKQLFQLLSIKLQQTSLIMFAILKKHNFFLFEIFLIIKIQALLAPVLSSSMLIQDKICLVQHQQSAEFCMNLQRPSRNSEEAAMQELVLADTVKFSNYVYVLFYKKHIFLFNTN